MSDFDLLSMLASVCDAAPCLKPAEGVLHSMLGPDWMSKYSGILLDTCVSEVFPQADLSAESTSVPVFLTRTPWCELVGLLHCAAHSPADSSRGMTKAINAVAGSMKATGRDIVPRIAHFLVDAFVQRDAHTFSLMLPGYFTLRFDRKVYRSELAVKEFFAYEMLGCSRDVVKPQWRFAECNMTVPGSLSLLRQMFERLPELVRVPWFKNE